MATDPLDLMLEFFGRKLAELSARPRTIPVLVPIGTPIEKLRACAICRFPLSVDQEQLCDECAARSA